MRRAGESEVYDGVLEARGSEGEEMKKIPAYEALVNSDLTEGRGPMRHVAYFTNRHDAERAVKGMGVMGVGDGEVKQIEITVYESFAEYFGPKYEQLRSSALQKLSREEREALGV